jgi:predicted membrane channel-forming protein YqfA (hemolysin III family)
VDEPSTEEKLGALLGRAKTSVANHREFMDRMVCAWILGLMCLWAVVALLLVYLHSDTTPQSAVRPLLLTVFLLYTMGCSVTFHLMEKGVHRFENQLDALEFAVYENYGFVFD